MVRCFQVHPDGVFCGTFMLVGFEFCNLLCHCWCALKNKKAKDEWIILNDIDHVFVRVLTKETEHDEGSCAHKWVHITRNRVWIHLFHFTKKDVLNGNTKGHRKEHKKTKNFKMVPTCVVHWVLYYRLLFLSFHLFLVLKRIHGNKGDSNEAEHNLNDIRAIYTFFQKN